MLLGRGLVVDRGRSLGRLGDEVAELTGVQAAFVGACGDDAGSGAGEGSVRIFARSGGSWGEWGQLRGAGGAAAAGRSSGTHAGPPASRRSGCTIPPIPTSL